jgi:hypothetical protein
MISIRRRKPVEQAAVVAADDVYIENMPLPPRPEGAAGKDFNIVLVVRDHAPARIDEINTLVKDYEGRIKKLKRESVQLHRLLAAIDIPDEE